MLNRHTEFPQADKRPYGGFRPGAGHVVAASLALAAGLSLAAFVTLYRQPVPADAFAALGAQIASASISTAMN